MSRFLQFDNVAFSYPGMAEPLLGGVTAHFPEGAWTGIVAATPGSDVSTICSRVQKWKMPDANECALLICPLARRIRRGFGIISKTKQLRRKEEWNQ